MSGAISVGATTGRKTGAEAKGDEGGARTGETGSAVVETSGTAEEAGDVALKKVKGDEAGVRMTGDARSGAKRHRRRG